MLSDSLKQHAGATSRSSTRLSQKNQIDPEQKKFGGEPKYDPSSFMIKIGN